MIFEVGPPRRLQNITRYKGEDLYASAVPDKAKSGLSIIVSGSLSLGFKEHLWIWIRETEKQQKANNEELEQENRERANRREKRWISAMILGTEEYNYLQALNRNIARYNTNHGPNKPRHMPRCSYWEFGEEIHGRSTRWSLD
ncbi:hypothetical protein HOY80DRAFT_1001491 [Tuber brumale]|nr:hypothetical protein HOY80DRAFT_1001491 [Tuber brumale]